jgi:hypothetical protein
MHLKDEVLVAPDKLYKTERSLEISEKNEEETMDVAMTNVDLGAGDNESMEVTSPNDQDAIRLMKDSDDNKDNCSGEQMDATKFTEEVENPTKGRTVDLIIIKPIEKKSTQQAIELQDVVVYNDVEGKALETP